MLPKWLTEFAETIALLIILSYLLFLILVRLLPKAKQCITKCKTFLSRRMVKVIDGEMNVEDQAPLNHGAADYNSCR